MQEYMAAIQQVYSDYNIQNPVDFLANIPNAVYVWDADLQVFVAQAAQE